MLRRPTLTRLAASSVTTLSVAALLASGPVLAWHPVGKITKGVSNITANDTAVHAADTAATAVTARPGDTLKYTIVIRNDGAADNRGWNDMGSTKLTDTLPTGLELVSGQTIDNIGLVQAQKSVTRTITVKVKANVQDGTIIDNQACFTGEATNNEAGRHQEGCDHALIKVKVPATPTPTPKPSSTPLPTPTPGQGEVQGAATVLPETGMAGALGTAVGLTALGGATVAYLRGRKNLR